MTIGLTGEDVNTCLPNKKVYLEQGVFHLKGVLENFFKRLGIYNVTFATQHIPMFSQESANISIEGKQIGVLGKVSDKVLKNFDFKTTSEVLLAEINLSELYQLVNLRKHFENIDSYPEVARDISLVVHKRIKFSQLEQITKEAGGTLLRSVSLVDYYLGGHIPKDSKGLTLSLIFQAKDHTLSDVEVSGVFDLIRTELQDKTGAEIR